MFTKAELKIANDLANAYNLYYEHTFEEIEFLGKLSHITFITNKFPYFKYTINNIGFISSEYTLKVEKLIDNDWKQLILLKDIDLHFDKCIHLIKSSIINGNSWNI